jgi:hypothetical protein
MAYEALARREDLSGAPDLVKEAVEVAECNYNADRDNRTEGLRDLQFLANDQWDPRDKREREADGRPVLTINRLIQPVKLVANSIRFSVPAVKTVPVDRESDEQTAWVLGGLIRQIQRQCMATWVYSVATGHAAACGIGHFRVLTDYVDDDVFDQEIKIKLIPHPFAVLWDAGATEPDRSDAMNCLVLEFVPPAEFKRRYPGAIMSDFQASSAVLPGANFQWFRPEAVVIAEYWRKVPYKRELGQLADGRVIDLTNVKMLPQGMQVVRTRTATSYRVEQTLLSGHEVLQGPNEWAGKHIPIVPIIGNEIPQESTVVRHGIVRFARDPQRMYNFWRSQSAEWIGQAAKSPWLTDIEQIEDFIDVWDTANTKPRPYLPYKRLPDQPQLKPERVRAAEPPAALWQEGSISGDEIKATTGMQDASLGASGNEISGRGIEARQRQGEIGNYEFVHNLGISLNHTGRILLDLAPKVYDTSRMVRILDETEKEHFVPINSVAYQQNGEPMLVHDLTAGKYDVAIKLGPSFLTRREASAAQMVEFLKLNPDAFSLIGDIVAEEQDWPGAAKVSKRLKRAVPPEILGDDAEEPPPPPDPLMVEGAKQEVREKKASADKKEAEARLALAEAELAGAKSLREYREAERTEADETELVRAKADGERMRAAADVDLTRAKAGRERSRAASEREVARSKAASERQLTGTKAMRERIKARVDVHKATRPEPNPKGKDR